MSFQSGRLFSKMFCFVVAVSMFGFCQNELDAQRPSEKVKNVEKRDGEVVPRRPDRRAINPVKNVLSKFRETRHFDNQGVEEFRTFNGLFNNLERRREGSIFTELNRVSPAAYGPFNSLARQDLPSAREISNAIANQSSNMPNDRGLSDFVWQWGQFMDHDIDLSEFQQPLEHAPIVVPIGDPIFDSLSTGLATIPFDRSVHRIRPFRTNLVRQQLNNITAWIDASNVYGSEEETADRLRTHVDGKMGTSGGGLFLPTQVAGNGSLVFDAGDIRNTEQTGLSCMHTLFVREHNRLATEIKAENPDFSDELIFHLARKEVYALTEAITFNEFLPALLGPDNLPAPYAGYNPAASPNVTNEFSGAAYRFGHSMLNNQLLRLDNDGNPIPEGHLLLRDAFFDATKLLDVGIEPYLKGLMTQEAQELDAATISGVRNFLFGNQPDSPTGPSGPLGLDLGALNIQRGRDHGLADFNTIRVSYGLAALNSFADLTSDPLVQAQLASVYPTVDDIDPWIGYLVEEHASNSSLGETAIASIREQFERFRDADRFWYENIFEGEDLDRINNTTLADVILRNTTLTNVQDNVFFVDD